MLKCERSTTPPSGMVQVKTVDGGALFKYPARSRRTCGDKIDRIDKTPKLDKAGPSGQVVKTYPYHSENGTLLFEVVRYEPKDFRQRRPDGKGGYLWSLGDTPRVLYRLPELLAADKDGWVFVPEGEKDVDNVRALGLTATCNPGGAGKWAHLADDSALHGRRVAILADCDGAGRKHALDIAARLYRKAADVRILDLRKVSGFMGKDVSDLLDANDSKDPADLARALTDLAESAPPWTGEEWPELTALREDAGEPPRFPVEALPPWLRFMVEGVAMATQTPPELAGSAGLAVVALAGAGKVRVEPSRGWHEPLCLFVAVALPPGCRKSAVFGDMTRPLAVWEKKARERLKPEIEKAKTEREILEKRLSALKRKAAEGENPEAAEEAVKLSAELAGKVLPVFPRLFASDVTPEAIARLLAEQNGRLGVFSAEGGELTAIVAGRYSKSGESNMEIFLKGHAGDSIRVDRANREREPIILDNPALTLALCVQPSVFESAWQQREFRERGLLARMLCVLPSNPLGTRDVDPPPIPHSTLRGYEEAVLALLDLPKTEDQYGNPAALALTDEARTLLRDFMRRLEPDLGPGRRYERLSGWYAKLPGAVARIAGGLHLARNPLEGGALQEPIGVETMRAALALGDFYAAHAERVHKVFAGTPEAQTAARVLDAIKRNAWHTFTERDLYRALGLRKTEAGEALAVLEETGHVRRVVHADAASDSRRGRKPSREWEVNPVLSRGFVNSVNFVNGGAE